MQYRKSNCHQNDRGYEPPYQDFLLKHEKGISHQNERAFELTCQEYWLEYRKSNFHQNNGFQNLILKDDIADTKGHLFPKLKNIKTKWSTKQ